MEDILKIMDCRSSIRKYKEEMLSDELIRKIAEAGLKAPTATNRQEIHITVVRREDPVQAAIQKDLNPDAEVNFYYDAPITYYLSAQDDFKWSSIDAGIAVENIHLAAAALGLGSVILGCMEKVVNGEKKEEYRKMLCIPEGYSYKIALAAGYPDTEKVPHRIDFDRDVTIK